MKLQVVPGHLLHIPSLQCAGPALRCRGCCLQMQVLEVEDGWVADLALPGVRPGGRADSCGREDVQPSHAYLPSRGNP
jgi:hypothetical protein